MTTERGFALTNFLKALVLDPFIELVVLPQIEGTKRLPQQSIFLFSKLAAAIGRQLPGGFNVERGTLSEELAARENLTLAGAHALMLRNLVNSKTLLGPLARKIIVADLGGNPTFNDLDDVARVLPSGSFKTSILKRKRVAQKALRRR